MSAAQRSRCAGCGEWGTPSEWFCWSEALDGWYCFDCWDPPFVAELLTPALGAATRAWLADGDRRRRVWRWHCPVCGQALAADRHEGIRCEAGCSPEAIGRVLLQLTTEGGAG